MKEIAKPFQDTNKCSAQDFGGLSMEDAIAYKKKLYEAQNHEADQKKIDKCFGRGPILVDGDKELKGDKYHKSVKTVEPLNKLEKD